MNYDLKILKESGYDQALLGLSLSYNKPIQDMKKLSRVLYKKDGGHNKFLESICIWLDTKMPRYWWQEFDTYRVGVTKQSESTIHTIFKRELTQDDFVEDVNKLLLNSLNTVIVMYQRADNKEDKEKLFRWIKRNLPEGFLQRRIICTNYKALRGIIKQRENHKLGEWIYFCNYIKDMCEYKEFLN